jgi:hypothetical protein
LLNYAVPTPYVVTPYSRPPHRRGEDVRRSAFWRAAELHGLPEPLTPVAYRLCPRCQADEHSCVCLRRAARWLASVPQRTSDPLETGQLGSIRDRSVEGGPTKRANGGPAELRRTPPLSSELAPELHEPARSDGERDDDGDQHELRSGEAEHAPILARFVSDAPSGAERFENARRRRPDVPVTYPAQPPASPACGGDVGRPKNCQIPLSTALAITKSTTTTHSRFHRESLGSASAMAGLYACDDDSGGPA